MSRPTLALYVNPKRAAWWQQHLQALLPDLDCRLWNDIANPEHVQYAVVWTPPAGWLAGFQNLQCIVSIGAGIDHVLADPLLPADVPVIRTTGADLTQRMREYVCLHVMAQHRQLHQLRHAQSEAKWQPVITPPAQEMTVGIMGLGKLGKAAAVSLSQLGYDVIGWAQRAHQLAGVRCYSQHQQSEFLQQAHLLVCLLPLTENTKDILNQSLFNQLQRGAGIINVARGQHLVEEDLLNALDSGQIGYATLDVFRQEPLPSDHPFWNHSRVTVTPHVASMIDPVSGGKEIARNLSAFMQGKPVEDLTDLTRGY